jgi:hypothetical protein
MIRSINMRNKLKLLITQLKNRSKIPTSRCPSLMRIWIRCKMSVKKSWSMNLSLWLGSKIAKVWRRHSLRKSISLKLNSQEWKEKSKLSFKNLLIISNLKQNKTLKETFKKLRETFITRIKSSQKKQCPKDTLLIITNERKQS